MKRQLFSAGLSGSLVLGGMCCAPHDDVPVSSKSRPNPPPAVVEKKEIEVPTALKPRIDAALENVHSRDLLVTNGFWTIFHGILGMGPGTTLLEKDGKTRVNALDEICRGRELRGLEFEPKAHGVDVKTVVMSGTYQGHQDQFIAEMAQWGMPRTRKFVIHGKDYTFEDFTRQSKMRASLTQKQELSWAVLIAAEYYGTDHRWTNERGEPMSVEDMVRYELHEPIDTAACGGTHRLFGLTWALHRHLGKGGKKEGVWQEAAKHIEHYKQQALQNQNSDGSFSSAYLAPGGWAKDVQQRINTTGHVLEWLALAMTDEELKGEKVQAAASALSETIWQNANNSLDGGSLYHATHGLHIYRTRVFGTPPPAGLVIPRPN